MDVLLRVIVIFIEAVILASITYVLLNGVRLSVFDLGLWLKYKKVVAMVLVTVGCLVVGFVAAYLISFYPTV